MNSRLLSCRRRGLRTSDPRRLSVQHVTAQAAQRSREGACFPGMDLAMISEMHREPSQARGGRAESQWG